MAHSCQSWVTENDLVTFLTTHCFDASATDKDFLGFMVKFMDIHQENRFDSDIIQFSFSNIFTRIWVSGPSALSYGQPEYFLTTIAIDPENQKAEQKHRFDSTNEKKKST